MNLRSTPAREKAGTGPLLNLLFLAAAIASVLIAIPHRAEAADYKHCFRVKTSKCVGEGGASNRVGFVCGNTAKIEHKPGPYGNYCTGGNDDAVIDGSTFAHGATGSISIEALSPFYRATKEELNAPATWAHANYCPCKYCPSGQHGWENGQCYVCPEGTSLKNHGDKAPGACTPVCTDLPAGADVAQCNSCLQGGGGVACRCDLFTDSVQKQACFCAAGIGGKACEALPTPVPTPSPSPTPKESTSQPAPEPTLPSTPSAGGTPQTNPDPSSSPPPTPTPVSTVAPRLTPTPRPCKSPTTASTRALSLQAASRLCPDSRPYRRGGRCHTALNLRGLSYLAAQAQAGLGLLESVVWNASSLERYTDNLPDDVFGRLFPGGIKNFRTMPDFKGPARQSSSMNCWFLSGLIDFLNKETKNTIGKFFRIIRRNSNWSKNRGDRRLVQDDERKLCTYGDEFYFAIVPATSQDDASPDGIKEGATIYVANRAVLTKEAYTVMKQLVKSRTPGVQLLATAADAKFGVAGRTNGRSLNIDVARFWYKLERDDSRFTGFGGMGAGGNPNPHDWKSSESKALIRKTLSEMCVTFKGQPRLDSILPRYWAITATPEEGEVENDWLYRWWEFKAGYIQGVSSPAETITDVHGYALTGTHCQINPSTGEYKALGVWLVNPWDFSREVYLTVKDYLYLFGSLIRVELSEPRMCRAKYPFDVPLKTPQKK